MKKPEIGKCLGIMMNSQNGYSYKEKGEKAAEIILYIERLETKLKEIELCQK